MFTNILFVVMSVTLVAGQRPSFAGTRPIGYPEVIRTTTEGLGNRFGEGDATTVRLPIEAKGDRDLVDRLSKLPVDQQPFWFINWQAYEAHRQNPQTYPQKPNVFVDPTSNNNMNFNAPNNNMNFNPPNNNMNFNNFPPNNNMNFNPPNNNMNFNNFPPNNNMNFNQNIPSFTTAQQTTQSPQSGNGNSDLNNRFSSDSLVPQKNDQPSKAPSGSSDTSKDKPQEYIIVNGVLYRVVESQKLPK